MWGAVTWRAGGGEGGGVGRTVSRSMVIFESSHTWSPPAMQPPGSC